MLSDSSPTIGGELNSAWNLQVDRIRRGKWLVLVLGLIAAVAVFAARLCPTNHVYRLGYVDHWHPEPGA